MDLEVAREEDMEVAEIRKFFALFCFIDPLVNMLISVILPVLEVATISDKVVVLVDTPATLMVDSKVDSEVDHSVADQLAVVVIILSI